MIVKGTDILKEHSKKNINYSVDLQRIDFLDRRVYKRSEGVYYPSVTSILSYMPKNKFFETWLKDVGHNADIIVRKAGEEGTQTHNAIEDLLIGREVTWMDSNGVAKYSELVWGMILKFKDFWEQVKPKLIYCERFSFSDTHKYAGTVDLVVEIEGKVWVLDIKTSTSLHKSYDLQLAAYSKALEEMEGLKIDNTGIIWLKSAKRGPSKAPGIYQGKGWELKEMGDIDNNFELFKNIYRVYEMDNPVTEPVYSSYPTTIKLEI